MSGGSPAAAPGAGSAPELPGPDRGPGPAPGAAFRRTPDGARWIAEGELTFASTAAAFAQTQKLRLPTSGVVACDGVTAADSAAIALLLALERRAARARVTLSFVGAPAVLRKLADLYDVEGILGA